MDNPSSITNTIPSTSTRPLPKSHPTPSNSDNQLSLLVSANIIFIGKILFAAAFLAFVSCILISIQKDWISSTETHCHVPNYLPSISAAIGGYSPQKYIWRIAIAAQSSPRILFAYINLQHNLAQQFHSVDHVLYPLLCKLTFFVLVTENVALVQLTYVSSIDWFLVHKLGFTLFVICSVLHQLLHIYVCTLSVHKNEDPYERRLIRRKKIITFCHLSSLASAMYCYWRHNEYCESGVYTLFAFFEYLVVASNMYFHYTFAYDFDGARLNIVYQSRSSSFKQSIA